MLLGNLCQLGRDAGVPLVEDVDVGLEHADVGSRLHSKHGIASDGGAKWRPLTMRRQLQRL